MDISADLNHQEVSSSSAIREEFELSLKETDWAEIFLILQDLIWEGLVDKALSSPPPAASPSLGQPNIHLAAPEQNPAPIFDLSGQKGMPSSHCQADICSQKQHNDIEKVARRNSPETAQKQKLHSVGSINGETVHKTPSVAASPTTSCLSSKRNCRYKVDNHVKQPPNAFMLFSKEQRPHIMAELNLNNSAAINIILGQRWKSLSTRDQARYYEEAEKEKQLHLQQHPGWSRKDSYVRRHALKHHDTTGSKIMLCNGLRRSQDAEQKLQTVGSINGETVHETPSVAASPTTFCLSTKGKCQYKVDDQWPYVKKPPNAFMLFRKEQRPHIMAELKLNNSAAINTILGRKWKSLSTKEQARYYEEAEKEKRLHLQQHPGWSCKNNYGKKGKSN